MAVLAWIAALAALAGMAQALSGWAMLRRFGRAIPPAELPPITVLKPLHGDEPLLEEALASLCVQDYPCFQLVCGVQNPADPAIAVVERLRRRFPQVDLALVVDSSAHGRNRKVGNLINMLPAARHGLLAIADSDVWSPPFYLRALAATLARPGIGLATTLYAGRPADAGLAARLGTGWLNHVFLPGALLARGLGRQDCLGATMALRRDTLERAGGLAALADHLADDHMLGRRVRALGLGVALAPTIVATTVPEATLGALFRHELRWGRTIRALEPAGFALSALQYPLAWSLAAIVLSGAAIWALLLFAAAWACRAAAAAGIDRELGRTQEMLATRLPIWLLPLRDLISVAVLIASHAGTSVEWRGQVLDTAPAHTEPHRHDEDALPAASLVRRLRRWRRLPLPGQT
jgi:ceramide glucosyltransferase